MEVRSCAIEKEIKDSRCGGRPWRCVLRWSLPGFEEVGKRSWRELFWVRDAIDGFVPNGKSGHAVRMGRMRSVHLEANSIVRDVCAHVAMMPRSV